MVECATYGEFDLVKEYLNDGADVDGVSNLHKHGVTALMAASSSGQYEIVKYLIGYGADIDFTPVNLSAIDLAIISLYQYENGIVVSTRQEEQIPNLKKIIDLLKSHSAYIHPDIDSIKKMY